MAHDGDRHSHLFINRQSGNAVLHSVSFPHTFRESRGAARGRAGAAASGPGCYPLGSASGNIHSIRACENSRMRNGSRVRPSESSIRRESVQQTPARVFPLNLSQNVRDSVVFRVVLFCVAILIFGSFEN